MKPHRYYGTDFAKKRTRSQAGKQAKKNGESFEDRLDTEHNTYRLKGRAVIDRLGPRTAGSPKKLRYVARAPIDFSGTIAGGRSVYLEAKSTSLLESGNPVGTLGIRHGGLNPEQVQELVRRSNMDALCLVLWWNGVQCGVFIVTNQWFEAGVGTGIAADRFEWLPDQDAGRDHTMTEQEIDIVVKHLRREAKQASKHAKRGTNHPSHTRYFLENEAAFSKAADIIESQKGRGA